MLIYSKPDHVVLDDVGALFFANNQFPIRGVKRIKGFREIYSINVRVEADELRVWRNAVNLQIRVILLYTANDIGSYYGVSRCTQTIYNCKPFFSFVKRC